MPRARSVGLRRKLVGAIAAYAIALEAVLSGLGLAALAASPSVAVPICSEHAAVPGDRPALPAGDPWLCPCAAACAIGHGTPPGAPVTVAVALGGALPASLAKCDSFAAARPLSRGPQIPRAPPAG